MQVGDLVRIKQSPYLNKLAIVVINGTWSVDLALIDPRISWKPRIAKVDCGYCEETTEIEYK